jgi:hypothetical protein
VKTLHDRYGQLRITKLRQNFPRVADVEAISAEYRFLHWELTFADIFTARGGFDLVLGNPPWLNITWSESGILGERNPLVAIRKLNATELANQRSMDCRPSGRMNSKKLQQRRSFWDQFRTIPL